jgi:hypothetical protein
MRRYASLAVAVLIFALIHEGAHALAAWFWNEAAGFTLHWWGAEVMYRTAPEVRTGGRWAVISGLPNVLTVLLGYLLLTFRRGVRWLPLVMLRDVLFYLTVLLLILDPINLSVMYFIFGGDAVGIHVGLGVPIGLIQVIAFAVLLFNRELLVRRLLPLWGVRTRHPLFRPLPFGTPQPQS